MIKTKFTKRLNVMKNLMGNNKKNHPYTNLNIAKAPILLIIYYASNIWGGGRKTTLKFSAINAI